jgi:hypothetical protein
LLVDSIRYGVRRLGLRNVLVDHLGFVVEPDSENERQQIAGLCRELSILGEFEGISIILVAHPTNLHLVQRRRVRAGDLKGASAIRQDAHEVWIVEKVLPGKQRKQTHPAVWVHLDKIRSDFGSAGSSVMLYFDPLACTYADEWAQTPTGSKLP